MINVTLLIQLFHFWVAYMIMTRILLKSVSTSLIKAQQEQLSLNASVDNAVQAISKKIADNKNHWAFLQKTLHTHQPTVQSMIPIPRISMASQTITKLDPENLSILVHQASDAIVQRITNDK